MFRTKAENKAALAQQLSAFQHLNLLGIRSDIVEMLRLIGTNSLFGEYTKHDISHIDSLLKSLDWIIPQDTAALFSPTDWLMLVLSIYLHDLGLLVTKSEWDNRAKTGFPSYKAEVHSGEKGEEYAAKVSRMTPEQAEAFFYQEYVRENHASRLRLWVIGSEDASLGRDENLVQALAESLRGLDPKFRRDLALICESHHLNDLDDFSKYKVRQPYGNSADETCNLQYAALMLRTADLLHVTQDRTPSIAFRLINPSDPKSVVEWRKQMPVVAVQPVPAKDKDGNVIVAQQSTSIGFHAYFKEHEGFFALSAYLNWAKGELRKSAEWAERARRREGIAFSFPWLEIDESDIEAEGFLKKEFQFTLDQGKILDLLTGHTLYNDVNVVIRELVQNGIDAVRLDAVEDSKPIDGTVVIEWSSNENVLTIQDTGTGMTQEIIERHFLKAGSSRYQDSEFKKAFPNFSPISRFGIGVLSAFMIADEVEVFTVSKILDEKPRKLTLRTLHGRYLIEEFERTSTSIPVAIRNHGTRISLRIRAGAEPVSVVNAAKHWIVFPPCKVTVIEDGKTNTEVGFKSPKEAVAETLRILGIAVTEDLKPAQGAYSIREFEENGLQLAVAVAWSSHFKEWSLMQSARFAREWENDELSPAGTGTCVEGIKIDAHTPGFMNLPLIAVANATGKSSPRTNVARSEFESTPERKALLSRIYDMYARHISNEISALHSERGFSPTWAAAEAPYLLAPLIGGGEGSSIEPQLLEASIMKSPCILLERDGSREIVSINEVNKLPHIWTLDSSGVRSLEALIKEIPKPLSLTAISEVIGDRLISMPSEPTLPGPREGSTLVDIALSGREVDVIEVNAFDRRLDLRWRRRQSPYLWKNLKTSAPKIRRYLSARLQEHQRGFRTIRDIWLGVSSLVSIRGLAEELGAKSAGNIFLIPDRHITKQLIGFVDRCEAGDLNPEILILAHTLIVEVLGKPKLESPREVMSRIAANNPRLMTDQKQLEETLLSDTFITALGSENLGIFDANAWNRGGQGLF